MVEIHDEIKRSLQAAESLYHRLVLLVGKSGSGKTGVLRDEPPRVYRRQFYLSHDPDQATEKGNFTHDRTEQ